MAFKTPPTWLLQPNKLSNLLNHSSYHTMDFNDCVYSNHMELFSQGVRQHLYWRRQLQPSVTPTTVMFSLLGPQGLQVIDIANVTRALRQVSNLSNALEFYQGPNTKFMAVSFKSTEDISNILTSFLYFDNAVVSYITPSSPRHHNFSLLWLPPLFPMPKVHHLLNTYAEQFTTYRGSIKIDQGYMASSLVKGTLTLKDSCDISSLPHLIKLPKPHNGSALFILSGRDPLCLKCMKEGHVRKNCPNTKCSKCSNFHPSDSSCPSKSFADTLSGSLPHSKVWPDDLDSDHILNHVASTIMPPVTLASPSSIPAPLAPHTSPLSASIKVTSIAVSTTHLSTNSVATCIETGSLAKKSHNKDNAPSDFLLGDLGPNPVLSSDGDGVSDSSMPHTTSEPSGVGLQSRKRKLSASDSNHLSVPSATSPHPDDAIAHSNTFNTTPPSSSAPSSSYPDFSDIIHHLEKSPLSSSSPSTISAVPDTLSSASTSYTVVPDSIILLSPSIPPAPSSIASDGDEPEGLVVISLAGLHQDTSLTDIMQIVGQPSPYSVYDHNDSEGNFKRFYLKYRCHDDLDHVLSLDGKMIGGAIVSTSVHYDSSATT